MGAPRCSEARTAGRGPRPPGRPSTAPYRVSLLERGKRLSYGWPTARAHLAPADGRVGNKPRRLIWRAGLDVPSTTSTTCTQRRKGIDAIAIFY